MLSTDVNLYISQDCIFRMIDAIKDNGGNEVFFVGNIDKTGLVVEIEALCNGNIHAVPLHKAKDQYSVLIHNHPSGFLVPSDEDIVAASKAGSIGQGFYIVDNELSSINIVCKYILSREIVPIDYKEASSFLENDGPLSKMSSFFEERPGQIKLLKNISSAFNDSKVAVFEAGTGVGKSFAYLIPAVTWAIKNKERVVISTGTINLQEQLVNKDIPMVKTITGYDFKAILMKGRQNYICLRRLFNAVKDKDLFSEDNDTIDELHKWIDVTSTGSRTDLTFNVSRELWSKINSESEACLGLRCKHREACFVMKNRKEAFSSNLIVVNHHLLFADIKSRLEEDNYTDSMVLPPYTRLIFDEAHTIDNSATSFFSGTYNRFQLIRSIGILYNKHKNKSGGLYRKLSIFSKSDVSDDDVYELMDKIISRTYELDKTSYEIMEEDYTLRFHEGTSGKLSSILEIIKELCKDISVLVSLIRKMMDGIGEEDKDISYISEVSLYVNKIENCGLTLNDFPMWNEKEDVFYISRKNLASDGELPYYMIYTSSPLDIAPMVNEGVYEKFPTVICTSATLTTGHSFNYFNSRNGLNFVEEERLMKGEYDSPFPYERNMLFSVIKDMPFPSSPDFQFKVEEAVERLILSSKGRTLVLFTSYESLNNTYNNIAFHLISKGYDVYKQGSMDSGKLLSMFKSNINSSLFATDSFWQGVDVQGESLSQVIIVKLPFPVPSDPVFQARSEALAKKHRSSFMELSIPQAVIKFRQGVGRLVRSSGDIGSVVVLDRRLCEKAYGSHFVKSLPECRKVYDTLENVCSCISRHIFN